MFRLVSEASNLQADRRAEDDFGFPPILLMEQAAARLWQALETRLATTQRTGSLAVLAGKGNNGGDAWAVARYARLAGCDVAVVEWGEPSTPSCRTMAEITRKLAIPVVKWPTPEAQALLASACLWLDGLWGAGFHGPLRPGELQRFEALLALQKNGAVPVAAIDLPSGLWGDAPSAAPVLAAEWTLVPGWRKAVCYDPRFRGFCGEIVELPLGHPRPAEATAHLLEDADAFTLVPPLDADAHKGVRGHVGLAGGAEGMSGALVLAARSAGAAGAGLVSLYIDRALVDLVAPQVPAFQVRVWGGSEPRRLKSWVAGPGWGQGAERVDQLATLLKQGLPTVIDADGLAAWKALQARGWSLPPAQGLILTPHPGEMARLTPDGTSGVAQAAELAKAWGAVVVLKGSVTWILAPDGRRAVWDGANSALGTGGSGDCLAGIAGAFLARGVEAYEAACAAVIVHAQAGADLARSVGWFTADALPSAVAAWEQKRTKRTNGG